MNSASRKSRWKRRRREGGGGWKTGELLKIAGTYARFSIRAVVIFNGGWQLNVFSIFRFSFPLPPPPRRCVRMLRLISKNFYRTLVRAQCVICARFEKKVVHREKYKIGTKEKRFLFIYIKQNKISIFQRFRLINWRTPLVVVYLLEKNQKTIPRSRQ